MINKKNTLLALGLATITSSVSIAANVREQMNVNYMDTPITVTYYFDTLSPVAITLPGYGIEVLEIPSDVRVVSVHVIRPSNVLHKEHTFKVTEHAEYARLLNSNLMIFKSDNNVFHRAPFAIVNEEQIRQEEQRKQHLKNLPHEYYEKVANFVHKNLGIHRHC